MDEVEAIDRVRIRVTPDGRVNRRDAALFLGKSPKTLAEWMRLGLGPKSHLVGGRRFYSLEDLRGYADGSKLVRPEAA